MSPIATSNHGPNTSLGHRKPNNLLRYFASFGRWFQRTSFSSIIKTKKAPITQSGYHSFGAE
jgi:hypothetical protein